MSKKELNNGEKLNNNKFGSLKTLEELIFLILQLNDINNLI